MPKQATNLIKSGAQSNTQSSSSASIPGMGQQEQDIVNQLQSVGMDQASAIKMALSMAQQPGSPLMLSLSGQDKSLLDSAYSGANANLQRQANIMKQDLAGTRGLNGSDTPVSDSVIREFAPQFANLASARANQELGLGLNLGQLNEGRRQFNLSSLIYGSQATPSALSGLANRFQGERFGQATQTGQNTLNPSIFQSYGQGLGLAGQFGAMGMGMMSPAAGAGGAAAAAPSTPGPWASGYKF